MKSVYLIVIVSLLICSNSYGNDQVPLWRSFNAGMSVDMVVNEINKLGLSKKTVKAKKLPKKPKYARQGYSPVKMITKDRLDKYSPKEALEISGFLLRGPLFESDENDNLAQVNLFLGSVPNPSLNIGCSGLLDKDAERAMQFFNAALSSKYQSFEEIVDDDIAVIAFNNDVTRVWLKRKRRYQKTLSGAMFKCDKWVNKISLIYGDHERILEMNATSLDETMKEVDDVL